MKSKLIKTNNIISIEDMLSSSTYYANSTNKCVYCHDELEDNESILYDGHIYQPYRCNCKDAQRELEMKQDVLHKLKELETLNNAINMDVINGNIDKNEATMSKAYNNMKEKESI